MRTLPIVALSCIALSAAMAQKTTNENEVEMRGQTPIIRPAPVSPKPQTFRGILVDASCNDRTRGNLLQPPMVLQPVPAENEANGGAVSADGISVDAKTVESERAGILEHQVPDLRMRVSDPSCAITGASRGFAVFTDRGVLLNLDEGGNTLATEDIQTSRAGRAMLSGAGPSMKPKVTVLGYLRGDRIVVSRILKMEP
jgi:hypothetical protein